MASRRDPLLLTPGPLTTSDEVKAAMGRDWGSRDDAFIEMTARVRERLLDLAGGVGSHVCVPLQGSGTFAVEAALGTLVPREGKVLILVNGAYGRRMARICEVIGRAHTVLETGEDAPSDPDAVAELLASDDTITHVAAVQCETTSGILNPIVEIAAATVRAGRSLLVDAMSAFGALELNAAALPCVAVMASANKCLEGVPGLAFVIAHEVTLRAKVGRAPSYSLDLYDQWRGLEANGQWRFTPPTQVLAALDRALVEHAEEGGVAGRGARYRRNCQVLVDGMRDLGFETFLPDALQAPIIVTFHAPGDARFVFEEFYRALAARGYLIYPGKLTAAETFRVGCIGRIDEGDMNGFLAAAGEVLDEMAVTARGRG